MLRSVLCLLVAAFAFAGCGGDEEKGSGRAGTGAQSAPSSDTAPSTETAERTDTSTRPKDQTAPAEARAAPGDAGEERGRERGFDPGEPSTAPRERQLPCRPARRRLVRRLARGVNEPGVRLRMARVVRSRDAFRGGGLSGGAVFVSADLQGAGLTGKSDYITWVVGRRALRGERGGIYPVGPLSQEFSALGAETDPGVFGVSEDSDGYARSLACVRRAG